MLHQPITFSGVIAATFNVFYRAMLRQARGLICVAPSGSSVTACRRPRR